jgi:nickel-dependent lactate racemase
MVCFYDYFYEIQNKALSESCLVKINQPQKRENVTLMFLIKRTNPVIINLPYGNKEIQLTLADNLKISILRSEADSLTSKKYAGEIVLEAMNNPIESPQLKDLAKGKKTVTIIISDHTRPVPSRFIIPNMLDELRQGNPDIDITLLVATGSHRDTTRTELISKLGEDIVRQEKIVVHDCKDQEANCEIGTLPSGSPLVINRLAVETDLLVAEGFIEPHFFAGFSGGSKSVLPGVCDQVTVMSNHCSKFIDSTYARTGILDNNPIQKDIAAAAKLAHLAFIVNAVINDKKEVVAAFAGDAITAHRKGCEYLRNYCFVKAAPADIVITTNGGAPLDQNIYQCVKGLSAAEATAKPGAILIICAECLDGVGGEPFYQSLIQCENAHSLYNQIMQTPQIETIQDQWQTQILARILKKHRVIFVTRPELQKEILNMKMDYAATVEEAFLRALGLFNHEPSVTVIPNGVSLAIDAGF